MGLLRICYRYNGISLLSNTKHLLDPDAAPYIQSYHTVRAIPQTQIDNVSNKDVFTQNPGYQ
jgi:hypothetical protein